MRLAIAMALGVLLGAGSVAVLAAEVMKKQTLQMTVTYTRSNGVIDRNSITLDNKPFTLVTEIPAQFKNRQAFFMIRYGDNLDPYDCYYTDTGTQIHYISPTPCP